MTRERNELVSSATFKHERVGAHHSAASSSKIFVDLSDDMDVDSVSGDVRRDWRDDCPGQVFGKVSGHGADINRTSEKLDTETAKQNDTTRCGRSELQRKVASSQRSVPVTHVESTQRMVSGMDKDGKVLSSQRSGQVPDGGLPRDGCARVNSTNLAPDSGNTVFGRTERQVSATRPPLRMHVDSSHHSAKHTSAVTADSRVRSVVTSVRTESHEERGENSRELLEKGENTRRTDSEVQGSARQAASRQMSVGIKADSEKNDDGAVTVAPSTVKDWGNLGSQRSAEPAPALLVNGHVRVDVDSVRSDFSEMGSESRRQVPDGNLTRDGCAKPNSTNLATDSGIAASNRIERQESSQRPSLRQRSRDVTTTSEMTRERNELVSSATFKHERVGAHHSAASSSKIFVDLSDDMDVDSVSGDVRRDWRDDCPGQVFGKVSGHGADINRTSEKLDTETAKQNDTTRCGRSELQRKVASSQRSVPVTHVESTQRMVSGMDKDGKVLGSQRSGQVPYGGLPRDGCAVQHSTNLSSDSGTGAFGRTERQESDTRPSLRQRSNDVTTKSEVHYEYEHSMSSSTSEVLTESSQFRDVTSSVDTVDTTGWAAVTPDSGGRDACSSNTKAKSPLPSGCNIPQVGDCAGLGRQQSDVSVASSKTNLMLPCGTDSDSRRQGPCAKGSRKTCPGPGRFGDSPNRKNNSSVPSCPEHVQSFLSMQTGDCAGRWACSPSRKPHKPPNPFGINDLEDEKVWERDIPAYAQCPDVGDFGGRFANSENSPKRARNTTPTPFGVNGLADAGGRQG